MLDEELIRALERLTEKLSDSGNAAGVVEARSAAVALWRGIRGHRDAVQEANRLAERVWSSESSPAERLRALDLARATVSRKVALLKDARQRAEHLLTIAPFGQSEAGRGKQNSA